MSLSIYMKHMNKHINKAYCDSLLFGVIVWLFWYVFYPSHLHYHEQFQMFLFTSEYLKSFLAFPGGLAQYIGNFFTQFYLFPAIGAFVIASCLVIIQLQTWMIACRSSVAPVLYSLSFVPAVMVWLCMCDENALASFPVAIILTLFALQILVRYFAERKEAIFYCVFVIPILYWIAGAIMFVFMAYASVRLILFYRKNNVLSKASFYPALLVVESILMPIAAQYIVQYPLESLFTGIGYYRFPNIIPIFQWTIPLILIIVITILTTLPASFRLKKPTSILAISILIALTALCVNYFADFDKEEIMKYDKLCSLRQWEEIVKTAENKEPSSPLSVACLNLALAKTGQFGDRMFEFYQNGPEGLIPSFQRDFTSPLVSAEIYYHLGMINTAQRFTFEAMEAIPDYQKSSRAYKRLAETALIENNLKISEKYVHALSSTLFYREWATQVQDLIDNPQKIGNNREYGNLQKLCFQEDFLYSDIEMEAMLGRLFQHNNSNKAAFEYLLAYTLQKKDLNSFVKFYPLGKDLGYNHIPRAYQEALIFMWTQNHPNFQGLPWSISDSVLGGVTEFAHIYMKQKNAEELLKEKYGKTFWYYLLFNKTV